MSFRSDLIALALGVALLASGNVATAADPSCAELKQLWQMRFVSDFNIKFATREFKCSSFEMPIAVSLYDLDQQFSDYRYGSRIDFYDIVRTRIRSLEFTSISDPYNKGCMAGIDIIARGTKETGRITICPFFMMTPREDRASILVHESRHLDRDDPLHDTCKGGKYSSMDYACDGTFHDGAWQGSGYNSTVIFMAANLMGGVRNELSRSVIQSAINAAVPERFNVITAWQIAKWRTISAIFGSL